MSMLRHINCSEATDRAPFFVLGALDVREAVEVREHLETCPQPHPEFLEFGSVVPYLAEAPEPVEPGPELRRRVVEAIEGDVRARRRDDSAAERLVASFGAPAATSSAPAAPTAPIAFPGLERAPGEPATPALPAAEEVTPDVAAEPVAIAERRRSRLPDWLLPLAAVMLIGVLAGWNLLLQGSTSEARHRAEVLRDAIVASEDPDAAVARLTGTEAAPDAGGFAAMPPDEVGYMVVHGLQPAPAGKTYQAWYIAEDGPRSAGLLDVQDDGLAVLEGLTTDEPVDAMGVTLEAAGGAPSPSLPILVQGSMEGG